MADFRKRGLFLFSLICMLLTASSAFAETGAQISWTFQIIGLLGGLAFFLYGMELMSDGMKKTAGDGMRSILATLTKNKYRGMVLGIIVTMIIQSGSATSVMLVGFVQARLMAFAQTIGVLIGSGIGMTLTAQLIAFKITDYALLMIAAGFIVKMTAKNERTKNIAAAVMGFGILFYGLKLMGDSMRPLRSSAEVINFLTHLANPVLGLLVGVVLTAVIQSSTAFIGILMILGLEGLVTLEMSIPMILGANIGTCVTAGFASIGASRDAKRVALANVLFRIFGVAIFMIFIPDFTKLVITLGERFHSDIAREIANAHSIFNVTIGLIMLPLTSAFASLILKIIPVHKSEMEISHTTTFLDDEKILSPALAIDLARAEIARMAGSLETMLQSIAIPFVSDTPKRDKEHPELTLLEGVDLREEEIDFLEEKIVSYLVKVAQKGASSDQTMVLYAMVSIVKDIESIGDIVHRNVLPLITKKRALSLDFSEEGREELTIYHQKVCKQIRLLKEAFSERDLTKAKTIMTKERKYLDLELQYRIRHLDRLVHERKESIQTHEIHMELMNLMAQIIVYSSNIAKTFLQTHKDEKKLLV